MNTADLQDTITTEAANTLLHWTDRPLHMHGDQDIVDKAIGEAISMAADEEVAESVVEEQPDVIRRETCREYNTKR